MMLSSFFKTYWQLMSSERTGITFLWGCGCWEVAHGSVNDLIPMVSTNGLGFINKTIIIIRGHKIGRKNGWWVPQKSWREVVGGR